MIPFQSHGIYIIILKSSLQLQLLSPIFSGTKTAYLKCPWAMLHAGVAASLSRLAVLEVRDMTRLERSCADVPLKLLLQIYIYIYERPPKPPTFWNSYTRTLILDTIMKLSGTIGVTQKTMTLDTHVRLFFIANIKSSGTMRDTQKTMTISATSFRGCNRFSPLLIYIILLYIHTL